MYNIFVIMPFDNEFQGLFEDIREISVTAFKDIRVFRADDLLNQQNILKDIVESIYTSNLIIADLTSLNPNVFYELGLAHALKKDVILLTQDVNELPFDLRSYRVIPYSLHFKEIEKFRASLLKVIGESIGGTLIYSNPVTDFIAYKQIADKGQEKDGNSQSSFTNSLLEDEEGLLDYIANMEECLENITEIMNDYSDYTNVLTDDTNSATYEINKANKNMSAGTATFIRKQARKLSTSVNDYVNKLDDINSRYESTWIILDKALANIIKNKNTIIENKGDGGFDNFIFTVESVKNAITDTLNAIDDMILNANSVKGLERNLTRSIFDMCDKLNKFMSLLKMSESSLERAVTFGKLIISK